MATQQYLVHCWPAPIIMYQAQHVRHVHQAIQNLMVVTLTIRTAIKMAQRQVHRMHVHNLQTVHHIHAVHVHREPAHTRTITVQQIQHAHRQTVTNLWRQCHAKPTSMHLA